MELEERITIIWQGQEVGILVNPMPDMWYLEGTLINNKSAAAAVFEALAKALDINETFRDLSKGINIDLKYESGPLNRGIILCLSAENILFLRRIIHTGVFDKVYRSN
ncbi:hypothetical protein QMK33_03080 [Hymenobacter sp. H14-R3]|uniref:hypothetical protein n=1 Tax=Hymenobacter sp. H14-R3 TaxID=3046308 RepID=UPI0024BB6768|nr:hypothetical protein [Hymenobacter sp. H14-R3]MDJ0364121.1 hypothetical protein [Hymenobacter sp. H14-R3]